MTLVYCLFTLDYVRRLLPSPADFLVGSHDACQAACKINEVAFAKLGTQRKFPVQFVPTSTRQNLRFLCLLLFCVEVVPTSTYWQNSSSCFRRLGEPREQYRLESVYSYCLKLENERVLRTETSLCSSRECTWEWEGAAVSRYELMID